MVATASRAQWGDRYKKACITSALYSVVWLSEVSGDDRVDSAQVLPCQILLVALRVRVDSVLKTQYLSSTTFRLFVASILNDHP